MTVTCTSLAIYVWPVVGFGAFQTSCVVPAVLQWVYDVTLAVFIHESTMRRQLALLLQQSVYELKVRGDLDNARILANVLGLERFCRNCPDLVLLEIHFSLVECSFRLWFDRLAMVRCHHYYCLSRRCTYRQDYGLA